MPLSNRDDAEPALPIIIEPPWLPPVDPRVDVFEFENDGYRDLQVGTP
jgi:hypothetical protein